jgi:hypothetical protein
MTYLLLEHDVGAPTPDTSPTSRIDSSVTGSLVEADRDAKIRSDAQARPIHTCEVVAPKHEFAVASSLKEADGTRQIRGDVQPGLIPDSEIVAARHVTRVAGLAQRLSILTRQQTRQQADQEDYEQRLRFHLR